MAAVRLYGFICFFAAFPYIYRVVPFTGLVCLFTGVVPVLAAFLLIYMVVLPGIPDL